MPDSNPFAGRRVTGIRFHASRLGFALAFADEAPHMARNYPLFVDLGPEGLALLQNYYQTPWCVDGQAAGVLADWVEEHAEALRAAEPCVAPAAWAALVTEFRGVFADPHRNVPEET